uniref:hypothetical protein n=1 Tax=Thaumasiovibrio occultus TaxID=1891184 RepID=UPI000B358CB6|nr:hypothetical protein [Thaumasiovibrio occultus]
MNWKTASLSGLVLLGGCTNHIAHGALLLPDEKASLPPALEEISGMWCDQRAIYAINDSGNGSTIFELDQNANIVGSRRIAPRNRDWEAMAGDARGLVIADIGNNRGSKRTFSLFSVPFGGSDILTTQVSYNDQTRQLPFQNHDFDAEAITMVDDDTLVLFSKSWETQVSRIYQLPLDGRHHQLSPYAYIELDWMITGAHWDQQSQQFIVVGYSSPHPLTFSARMAVLDHNYKIVNDYRLMPAQVESVCVLPDRRVVVGQEESFVAPARLSFYALDELDE